MFLTNKNVTFIAGLGGIGLATCKELLKRNLANLVILDCVENAAAVTELKSLNPKVNVEFEQYDVTVPIAETTELFKKIIKKLGTIDILIYGAGICEESDIERTVAINLTGLIKSGTAIVELWNKSKGGPGGIICNIASILALEPIEVLPVYSATKAGILSFTKSLAKLQPITGVSAYSINPGLTKTKIGDNRSWLDLFNIKEAESLYPVQSAEICGENLVKAIEANQNGAIWVLQSGGLEALHKPSTEDSKKTVATLKYN